MRILFFAPRKCWPLNSGARLRDYHLATQLARHAEVTYLGLCYPEEEQFDADDVGLPRPDEVLGHVIILPKARPYVRLNLVRGLIGPTPVTVLNWTSAEAAVDLAELGKAGRFDAIHLVGVHLLNYLPVLRAFPGRPPILCDWHDIQSEKMWRYSRTAPSLPHRLYAARTAQLLQQAERRLLLSCDAHAAVSDRDRCALESAGRSPDGPPVTVTVIENGVDTAYFRCPPDMAQGVADSILFVGAMDYNANVDAVVWFAHNVWGQVRDRFPALRFRIVGRKPDPAVLALKDLAGVEVTGTVPDVRPYYRKAAAMVVPLHWGSGTRLKILEAMAAGIPVVSTPLGAEGLDAVHETDILIADTPEKMLGAISSLQSDPELRARLIANGLRLAESKYDWSIPGQRLFGLYEQLLLSRAPPSARQG